MNSVALRVPFLLWVACHEAAVPSAPAANPSATTAIAAPPTNFDAGVLPDVSAAAQLEPKKPDTPESVVEEERSVSVPAKGGDAAVVLACSFMRPKDAKSSVKHPAVIFVTGSGPEDRDEDTIGPGGVKLAIFKRIAIALAKSGVASLRCDDRGTAKSSGDFSSATLDTFVRDARATLDALKKEPTIDPARVGLVGHSEGGVIGPRLAAEDKSVRALFLLAAPGENMADIGIKQLEKALRATGASDEQVRARVAQAKDVMDAIRAGNPLPSSLSQDERAGVEKKRAWLKTELDNDPIRVASKVACPVFLAQGSMDTQVPPEDAELLATALRRGGNRDVSAKLYSGLSHVFAPTTTGSVAEYSDPATKMSDQIFADATAFLTRALK